jgi:hypothetical protein
MKFRKLVLAPIAAAVMTFVAAGPASALTVNYSGTSGGSPVSATADFTFGGSFTSLSVALTNTTLSIGGIAQSLAGVSFGLTGGPLSALSLVDPLGNPDGTYNCTTGTCVAGGSVSLGTSGWTFNSGTGLLAAGDGSWKNYAIMNSSIDGSLDGTSNGPHNPWLNGTVTFNFAIDNANHTELGVTPGNTYWGTLGTPVLVPEPETYAMLLAGLGLMGLIARRRQRSLAA